MPVKRAPIGSPPIHPTAVYTRRQLLEMLPWLGYEGITAEVKAGRLRRSSRLGRDVFLGSWVMDWLANGEVTPPTLAATA